MADSSQRSTDPPDQLFPSGPHSAIICGMTGCGKTVFMLDLLEGPYRGLFQHIVLLCPTVRYNEAYQKCPWIWSDPEVYVIDPGERLHDYLRAFYQVFQCERTLYIIDDCSTSKALTKKKDMLSELAFSGRHAGQSVWVLTPKRHAGSPCSTAKTKTASMNASVKTTSFPRKSGL